MVFFKIINYGRFFQFFEEHESNHFSLGLVSVIFVREDTTQFKALKKVYTP